MKMYYNPGIITLVLDQKAERILESAVRVLLIDRASVIRDRQSDWSPNLHRILPVRVASCNHLFTAGDEPMSE